MVNGARVAPGAAAEIKTGAKVQVGGTVIELG
jgi:hypothetical protein